MTKEQYIENFKRTAFLKAKLAESDYKAIKYAEGELTEEEYAPIREERRAWRAEINRLEAEFAELKTEVQE